MAKKDQIDTEVVGEVIPAPVPPAEIPAETKALAPTYKEIQDGDIIPGKSREESQAIYDAARNLKHPQ